MSRPLGETPVRLVALSGFLLALILVLLAVRILLVPIVAALFVAYLFDPGILAMQRRGMDRDKAFLVLLGLSLLTIISFLMVAPSWMRLESVEISSEMFTSQVTFQLKELNRLVSHKFPMFRSVDVAGAISARAGLVGNRFFEELPNLVTSFFVNLLFVPFIAYFMVRDGKNLKRRIVELVPNRYFEMSLITFHRIDQQIGGYLRGRLFECILVGLTQAVCMGIAHIFVPQDQILLISAACGITSMIPYLGPVMGTTFGVFLYLSSGLPMASIYGLVVAAACAHLIDNLVIAPAVLSHNVDLHPLSVALVLFIGGELMGTLGLLIAIPVASAIKVIGQEFYANYQLSPRT
jgi:predicted PurR-regulated permease PerM